MLGATVLAYATRRFIVLGRLDGTGARSPPPGSRRWADLIWLFGVYQKEASVCFFAMAPFLYLYLNRRWRELGVIDRALTGTGFRVTAIAMLLPVLHMLYQLKKLANEGTTVYGAPVPAGTGGAVTRLKDAFDLQWNGMTLALGTSFWRGASIGSRCF